MKTENQLIQIATNHLSYMLRIQLLEWMKKLKSFAKKMAVPSKMVIARHGHLPTTAIKL